MLRLHNVEFTLFKRTNLRSGECIVAGGEQTKRLVVCANSLGVVLLCKCRTVDRCRMGYNCVFCLARLCI